MTTAKDTKYIKDTKNKLSEANALLKDVAKENQEHITNEIRKDIKGISKLTSDIKEKVGEETDRAADTALAKSKEWLKKSKDFYEESKDKTMDTIENVDRSAKKNPWYFVGGAALVGAITGYFLSKRSK